MINLVNEIRREMPRLGTRKLHYLLKAELTQLGVGRDKLFMILKANHMLIKPKRSYHITTNSHHRFRKHKNRTENLELKRPEQLWVADITYIGNRKNPMYLALVTDVYSKKIMGYDVSDSLQTKGSVNALKQAIRNREYKNEQLIHHSERALQYCSNEYQHIISKNNLLCSMTENYDPYQNAVTERINGILKQEFLLNSSNVTIKLMKTLVKQSIEIYNQKRLHWSCSMLTPNEMSRQRELKVKTYKNKNLQEFKLLEI